MLAEFSIIPTSGPHMGEDVASVIEILENAGLDFRVGPMATTVEGDLEQVMATIQRCHALIAAKHPRVMTSIVLDDCHDRRQTLADAVARVEAHLGHAVNQA
ncbi:MAG TPA: MTH1187 family thiamine-binding protein [Pirellulales bacterium]|nr:MTH1187 family thiamine-binding protein [Pirellulales bacterium]